MHNTTGCSCFAIEIDKIRSLDRSRYIGSQGGACPDRHDRHEKHDQYEEPYNSLGQATAHHGARKRAFWNFFSTAVTFAVIG